MPDIKKNRFVNKRKRILEAALLFLGLDIATEVISYATLDKFNIIRGLQTAAIAESGQQAEKDWICYGDDPCDFCLSMEAGSPYPADYDIASHPNCLCDWTPTKGE